MQNDQRRVAVLARGRASARAQLCNDESVTDDLRRLDSESEQDLPTMVEIIAEELGARLAVGDFGIHDPA